MTDFNDIYAQYFRDVYRYVFSLCKNETIAEDVTQEAFFKALRNIDGFDGKCKMLNSFQKLKVGRESHKLLSHKQDYVQRSRCN